MAVRIQARAAQGASAKARLFWILRFRFDARWSFKASPDTAQSASVRQLRTTAAPAIAVEVSSVTVEDRADLDRMAPGVADAIARGAAAFRPSYVVPSAPGALP